MVTTLITGVKINFDPRTLSNDWSLCYNGNYSIGLNSSLIITILSTCYKAKLMLGCRPIGQNLSVAAMGLRNDVLYNCSTISSCTHVANGVGWYYSDSYSWGFVNNTDSVTRSSCDTAGINSNYRLCWHTQSSGGYRCGSVTATGSTYERVIYHAN
ncbi:hypothetical protein I4U23_000352 [Adineta vaga]|nr:hypothetical protein I4U23_000352 [Adineta vaga]